METKSAMIICSPQIAKELIEMNENFKQVICICPWLDDSDSVLVVDKSEWCKLVDASDVYLRKDVAGVVEHEED